MNSLWGPEHWDDFSIIGLLTLVVAAHLVAYFRGWIVPGKYHTEMIDARDREIGELRKRAGEDAKTIFVLAQTGAKTTAAEDTATQLLAAVRDIAERAKQ